MNLRLKQINARDTAKICAFLYAVLGIIYVLIGIFLMASEEGKEGGIGLIIVGVLLPLLGWIMVWIMTKLFNWIMKVAGGIRVEFDQE